MLDPVGGNLVSDANGPGICARCGVKVWAGVHHTCIGVPTSLASTTATPYRVSSAVRDRMTELGDEPQTHEDAAGGGQWTQTIGASGKMYVRMIETGDIHVYDWDT